MHLAACWDLFVDFAIRALCVLMPWRHRVVPAAEDPSRPLLRQFALLRASRWGALYLQHFVTPEAHDFAHIHRWMRMRSWVLSGFFIEERPIDFVRHIAHFRFTSYTMDRSVIHRVAEWSPRCWTLFWMSPETTDAWGWFPIVNRAATKRHHILGSFRPWREHIVKRVASLDTGRID